VAAILKVIQILRQETKKFDIPWVSTKGVTSDPYKVLISCILSLRTKDAVTRQASERLFSVAETAQKISTLSVSRLEKLIYPVGFYRNKARQIIDLSYRLINDFDGKVPRTRQALLSFKGVGRKTANLVLGLGFNIPAVCVDTHVHRISNRLGWIRTKKPVETEFALMKLIPKRYWIELNTVLVTLGQNICLPVSPFCSKCSVNRYCRKVGVTRHR
jgi:endonuclease-3